VRKVQGLLVVNCQFTEEGFVLGRLLWPQHNNNSNNDNNNHNINTNINDSNVATVTGVFEVALEIPTHWQQAAST
jgi:hypothetical protein